MHVFKTASFNSDINKIGTNGQFVWEDLYGEPAVSLIKGVGVHAEITEYA